MIKKEKLLLLLIIIGATLLYSLNTTKTALAKDCGGAIDCDCGDTVIENYTLPYGLGCSKNEAALIVGANNIIIDGAGNGMNGATGRNSSGILNNGYDNIVIRNFSTITNFDFGINFSDTASSSIINTELTANNVGVTISTSSIVLLEGNTINSNITDGIYIASSTSVTLNNNEINLNNTGVKLSTASANTISNNTINSNITDGIYIASSTSVTLNNNEINLNNTGVKLSTANANTISNNTINSNLFSGVTLLSSSLNNIENNTLNSNSNRGIYLTNSDENDLDYNTMDQGVYGIYFDNSDSNVLSNNNIRETVNTGIMTAYSSFNTIDNNILTLNNQFGINIITGSENVISNNTIRSNASGISILSSLNNDLIKNDINYNAEIGITLSDSDGNSLTENTLAYNNLDIVNDSVNTFSNNLFLHNVNSKMFSFTDANRIFNIGDYISLNSSVFGLDGSPCPECLVNISSSPAENININKSDNTLNSAFTASRAGTYSLLFNINDTNGNITKRKLNFLIGSGEQIATTTTSTYMRGVSPTNGQRRGAISDVGSLNSFIPTETESWTCGAWIQNYLDEINNFPLAVISRIEINSWYKWNGPYLGSGYVAAQKNGTYGMNVDATSTVPESVDFSWFSSSLNNLDWAIDYPSNWYLLSLKFMGNNPFWQTTPSQPSYTDFIYKHTTTPAIRTISNLSVNILSATSQANNPDNAQIVLENPLSLGTTTEITLDEFKRPFLGASNTINADGTTVIQAELNGNTNSTLNAVPLDITIATGSIIVNIDTWNTNGNYYKKWTENGSAHDINSNHVIGDLRPNASYSIKVDGNIYNTYTANSAGKINFTYSGGYSVKTFEIEEKITSGGSGGGSIINNCNQVEYSVWGNCVNSLQTRSVLSKMPLTCNLSTQQQIGLTRSCLQESLPEDSVNVNNEETEDILSQKNIFDDIVKQAKQNFSGINRQIVSRIKGRVLLQVESRGEAWYVNPKDEKKYYLGLPEQAFKIMRNLSVGINNSDLWKIPVGLIKDSLNLDTDSDGDGLSDRLEKGLMTNLKKTDSDDDGYSDYQEIETNNNPNGKNKLTIDKKLINKLKGQILLQVENNGEAWYLNPLDQKRYYLGRPEEVFHIMSKLGLGASNDDLNKIPVGENK
jgi:parallel beta-helix repeat protein